MRKREVRSILLLSGAWSLARRGCSGKSPLTVRSHTNRCDLFIQTFRAKGKNEATLTILTNAFTATVGPLRTHLWRLSFARGQSIASDKETLERRENRLVVRSNIHTFFAARSALSVTSSLSCAPWLSSLWLLIPFFLLLHTQEVRSSYSSWRKIRL